MLKLRWRKEWICSESPLTMCAIAKGWTLERFLIWYQPGVTREKGPIGALASFTLQRNRSMRRARLSAYCLRLACSGWPAGFTSTCFIYLRLKMRMELHECIYYFRGSFDCWWSLWWGRPRSPRHPRQQRLPLCRSRPAPHRRSHRHHHSPPLPKNARPQHTLGGLRTPPL